VRRQKDSGFDPPDRNYSSNSLLATPDWRMIDCNVPMRISE
jgi:hypothetical protein